MQRLAEVLPTGVSVTILADRGFADHKLLTFVTRLGFDHVIRLRGNIQVTAAGHPGPAVVCVHARDMKEPWCLATSKAEATAPAIIRLYARRWTIEPSFRDTKDLRFGMGLSTVRVSDPQRRDRLLLLNAFATVLLTLLGQAGESPGMDRQLKTEASRVSRRPFGLSHAATADCSGMA